MKLEFKAKRKNDGSAITGRSDIVSDADESNWSLGDFFFLMEEGLLKEVMQNVNGKWVPVEG